jgi:hypothetical protein
LARLGRRGFNAHLHGYLSDDRRFEMADSWPTEPTGSGRRRELAMNAQNLINTAKALVAEIAERTIESAHDRTMINTQFGARARNARNGRRIYPGQDGQ